MTADSWEKTAALMSLTLPPPPSSAGVPRTVSCKRDIRDMHFHHISNFVRHYTWLICGVTSRIIA